ncbi:MULTISPECIES: hypothetical protein [Streptomyces]|uniref:Integral membrane protein n=1 Tax=Streptomyces bobili TaxID=67280 RepID=A0ABZ1QZK1_9ACTN|nr:hypothetical protein [Streptomyces bobili]
MSNNMPLHTKSSEFGPWELREGVRARASELEVLLDERIARHPDNRRVELLARQAMLELDKAREAVLPRGHARWYKMGAHVTVGQIHLDTAHNLLLRLSEPQEVIPMMPGVLAFVREHLPPSDPRREQVELISGRTTATGTLTPADLETVLDAVGVARKESIREALRIRSFVHIVALVTFLLWLGAALVAVLGGVSYDTLPLCFTPSQGIGEAGFEVVCPVKMTGNLPPGGDLNEALSYAVTRVDYLVVEIVGIVAAGISAATSLHKMRGTAAPYNIPVVLAALKLPTGALTAVLGLLLMRGGFIPGLSALDSSAQIIAWAIIFGYSQQLFTRLVDSQAEALLNSFGPPPTGAVPPPPPPSGLAGQPPQ